MTKRTLMGAVQQLRNIRRDPRWEAPPMKVVQTVNGPQWMHCEPTKPRTTAQLIDVLVKHYGSPFAVNDAARSIWQQDGFHKMSKVDALWALYEQLQQKEPTL